MKNIIPHFNKYPLNNIKELDFLYFKLVVNMIYNKEHLKKEKQVLINNIIKRMNNKRN
jgi:hypothetical protein